MVDAVVKIGGSFQADTQALKNLCQTLKKASNKHRLLIVPGGGKFADLVRHLQQERGLSDQTAHVMAIFGTNIFGYMLQDFIKGSTLTRSLKRVGSRGCSIFLPLEELRGCEELEPSWNVTSDSIAAWTSAKIGCKRLILVKMVNGIFRRGKLQTSVSTQRLKEMNQSVVDRKLPELLERAEITCWVVNGNYPERIEEVLNVGKTVCTVIVPGA
ncbi:MAG: hypothetical protein AVW06_02130 [Hadesarchaea archaeon DG-33-1]|nr:MAG: hypothetical protein AVW06_02130 [Hadesarchaea archaeon DG-33-1]